MDGGQIDDLRIGVACNEDIFCLGLCTEVDWLMEVDGGQIVGLQKDRRMCGHFTRRMYRQTCR